ncbi:MAG: hypothetical protein R3E79_06205 [Caldilineaceae bacterium]
MEWKEWERYANHEALWHGHEEKGLLKAEYLHDYVLRLWFEEDLDVSIYELDFYQLIVEDNPGGVFAPLQDKTRFSQAVGDYALLWLNPETQDYDEAVVDIAPECIRFFCEKYGKPIKVTGRQPIMENASLLEEPQRVH